MPEAAGGRSYGGAAIGLSGRGAGSNSFDCGGYGRLRCVEKDGGLRISDMVVKGEGECEDGDEGDFTDRLSIRAIIHALHTAVGPGRAPRPR